MHRKREEAAQVALKIACRIPAKCQQVFVESPDFAPVESLPNLPCKANADLAAVQDSRAADAWHTPIKLNTYV